MIIENLKDKNEIEEKKKRILKKQQNKINEKLCVFFNDIHTHILLRHDTRIALH